MKRILLVILSILSFFLSAQQPVIDSLIAAIPKQPTEKKVDALNVISDWYHRNDETKSMQYANEALTLASGLNYKKGIIAAYSNLSYSKLQQSAYKESLELSIKALKLSETIKDKRLTAESYVNIANAYLNMFNFALADKNYLFAAKLYNELRDSLNVAIIYTNIAVSFDNREMLDSALSYYNRSFPIYNNIKNNKMYLGVWYVNVGDVYRKQEKYKEALEYQLKAELLLKETKDDFTLMVLYSGMPYTYIKINQLDKALEYAYKSVEIGIRLNAGRELSYSYLAVADVYEAKKDLKNQIVYLKKHITLNDSVLSEETSNTITEMQSKYENDKKEKEIELLNKSQALQEAEIEQHKTKQLFYIGSVFFILVISVVLAFGMKNKQKANTILSQQNKVIEHQKNLVEEKNKEISDSINYAERIQRSFLASKELLDEKLENYFVFFRPKDIVSGDFYWAASVSSGSSAVGSSLPAANRDLFCLVTADSTGHGVPGAIMSLLNITSLESAIKDGLTEPSDILNATRKTIIERLKKDGSADGGRDGMDCSLMVFDKEKKRMTYSAANNPIWIIRNVTSSADVGGVSGSDLENSSRYEQSSTRTDKGLIELSSDKMPVGKHERDTVSFAQHTVDLEKGDIIYTLTDGFSDQFGGPNGKKFMHKKLKEIFISISGMPLSEQKDFLDHTLKEWMGNTEQVDDITIIGIRV